MSADETVTLPAVDPFDAEFAEDYVHLSRDLATGDIASIYVEQFDDPHLNRGSARAVALRLLAFADEWDGLETRPTLRLLPDVQELAGTEVRSGGRSDIVVIFDEDGLPAHRLSPNFARALACRLQELADECERTGPGSALRRPTIVDEELRERDV